MRFYHTFVLMVIGLVAACQSDLPESKSAKIDKPNILVILTDDLKHDTIGKNSNGEVITPNIDKLAESGVMFDNAYIMGSPHAAVCAASRAMLMTGKHFFNLEESTYAAWEVPREQKGQTAFITFPEYLKQQGYFTFATGKQNAGRFLTERGLDKLSAGFFGGMSDHFNVPLIDYSKETGWGKRYKKAGIYSSEVFADATIDFLKGYDKNQPFMAYLSFTAPHDPRTAPQNYHQMYESREITYPKNLMAQHPFPIADFFVRAERLVDYPRDEKMMDKEIRDYYAMTTSTDYQIGRVFKQLEESGLAENTIIVFSSDNGLALGQHGLVAKQTVYEHSVKIPLIISGPNFPKGKRTQAYAYLHDVFPTIVDVVGGAIPTSIDTKSLLPVLEKTDSQVRDALFYTYNAWRNESVKPYKTGTPFGSHRAVRKGDFKLIVSNKGGVTTEQLFNLKRDPWELDNLLLSDENKAVRDEMFALLQSQMTAFNDDASREYHSFGKRTLLEQ